MQIKYICTILVVLPFLFSGCFSKGAMVIGYVKTVPDIEPVPYSSNRPVNVFVEMKVPDEVTMEANMAGTMRYTNWRTTLGQNVAEIFRPHFPNLYVVTEDLKKGIYISVTKAEYAPEYMVGHILSYRILIRQDGTEIFRVEGRAAGTSDYRKDVTTTYQAALEIALKAMQKDVYNKLFVSAEGKGFRNALK